MDGAVNPAASIEKRVRMAALLMDTQRELNNRDIAEYVGFRDPDYFGKVFKRLTGATPKQFRRGD